MVEVEVQMQRFGAYLDATIVELLRVPCIGETVVIDRAYWKVIDVIHDVGTATVQVSRA